jgi:hypothetical protein
LFQNAKKKNKLPQGVGCMKRQEHLDMTEFTGLLKIVNDDAFLVIVRLDV